MVWIKTKKAGMGIIVGMMLTIISFLFLFSGISLITRTAETGLQDAICSAQVVGGSSFINKQSNGNTIQGLVRWGSKETVRASLKNPLCTTKEVTIDISNKNKAEDKLELVTTGIGEMIENCWQTFGEGKAVNTFGQEGITWTDWNGDQETYYFSCYKFKIIDEDPDYSINVNRLYGEKGTLWQYNIKGKKLFDDFTANEFLQISQEYKNNPSADNTPYAGYVNWQGNGYLSFAKELSEETRFDDDSSLNRALQSGAAGLAAGVALTFICGPCGLVAAAYTTAAVATTTEVVTIYSSFYDKIPANPRESLDTIESDRWYEVRYYSPFVEDSPEEVILNNIKIMPAGASGGELVYPIAVI